MATVRQSIKALYEEAQRSAVEVAPMLAVLKSDAAGPDALPDRTDTDNTIPLPAKAIATRFKELRRLAELEAGVTLPEQPAGNEPLSDVLDDPLAGIDLSAGFTGKTEESRNDTAKAGAAIDDDEEAGAPVMDDTPGIPVIDIPLTGFGAAPEDTIEPVPEKPGDSKPPVQAVTSIETRPSLPKEPPAPASDNTGDNLDIAEIHNLVREAWEDETALGEIASPKAGEPNADHHTVAVDVAAADVAATGNIETAMQEIAAAVVQSAVSGQGFNVEAMKSEIIAAMRAELQAVVDSDLKSVIKTAVAEAMADMPAEAPPAEQAAKKAPKVTQRAPAKKAAKAAAKAAAKTAKKKTANSKAIDDNES